MKLRILSDLHLECYPFTIPTLEEDGQTVLILAGDICQFSLRQWLEPFLIQAGSQFRAVLYVPGNHEYYNSVWPRARLDATQWALPANVHILDRQKVVIDSVAFLGATLWTDVDRGDPLSMVAIRQGMADYAAIDVQDAQGARSPLSIGDTMRDHALSRQWFHTQLELATSEHEKVVMITHHGVTPKSIAPQFEGSPLNPGFVSDLSGLLLAHSPDLVIHGHTHDSLDYYIGSTRVITNPRGYTNLPNTQENGLFNPEYTIRI